MSNSIFNSSCCSALKMYIAFKWLVGLSTAMWIAICCLDVFVKRNGLTSDGFNIQPLALWIIKNKTGAVKSKMNYRTESFIHIDDKQNGMTHLHCLMFIAGALVVAVYNRINDIIVITKREISNILTSPNTKRLQEFSKVTAIHMNKAALKFSKDTWDKIKNIGYRLCEVLYAFKLKMCQKRKINLILLKKLKEIGEQRTNLAQLLLTAIHENKNIRIQYQLEIMAKKRLVRHIEDTQKMIKENRSRYVSFQQLYLVTHQENSFLKSRLLKLTKDKEEAERNLLDLMNEVYKSKNNELKAYCSRFIVRTQDNLLNSDVRGEIQKFLQKSRNTKEAGSNWLSASRGDIAFKADNNWLRCSSHTQITEIEIADTVAPLVSQAPKLKGLPGEFVWTVKDKDGLIEKLYEYDCGSDFDNGDTIRRIRQYSVYYDKDCLLDFANSSTVVNETMDLRYGIQHSYMRTECPLAKQKFLTGSVAFQKFMQNNKNLVTTSIVTAQPLHSD